MSGVAIIQPRNPFLFDFNTIQAEAQKLPQLSKSTISRLKKIILSDPDSDLGYFIEFSKDTLNTKIANFAQDIIRLIELINRESQDGNLARGRSIVNMIPCAGWIALGFILNTTVAWVSASALGSCCYGMIGLGNAYHAYRDYKKPDYRTKMLQGFVAGPCIALYEAESIIVDRIIRLTNQIHVQQGYFLAINYRLHDFCEKETATHHIRNNLTKEITGLQKDLIDYEKDASSTLHGLDEVALEPAASLDVSYEKKVIEKILSMSVEGQIPPQEEEKLLIEIMKAKITHYEKILAEVTELVNLVQS